MTGRHRMFDAKRCDGWIVHWAKEVGHFIKIGQFRAFFPGGFTVPVIIPGELGVDR
jgi:hypothetical protein